MEPTDFTLSAWFVFKVNDKYPQFEVGDYVKISRYKYILVKGQRKKKFCYLNGYKYCTMSIYDRGHEWKRNCWNDL